MPGDRFLNVQEITGILDRLGFAEIYRTGMYAVYSDQRGRPVLLHLTTQWDRPFNDLVRQLASIGLTRAEVEAALESLYTDH